MKPGWQTVDIKALDLITAFTLRMQEWCARVSYMSQPGPAGMVQPVRPWLYCFFFFFFFFFVLFACVMFIVVPDAKVWRSLFQKNFQGFECPELRWDWGFLTPTELKTSLGNVGGNQMQCCVLANNGNLKSFSHLNHISVPRVWKLLLWDSCLGSLVPIPSMVSLAAVTTPEHSFRSDLRAPNLKIFPGGSCPQTPL